MKHSNISIFIPHMGCPFNCIFCDQFKITGSDQSVTPSDVYTTLTKAYNDPCLSKNDTQIAFFGGSFTAIDRKLMVEYLSVASEFIGSGKFNSIRISTRPDFIDDDVLNILKLYNVKTIELGIQSFDDEVLKASGRGYDYKTAIDACKLISKNGFDLGIQMMCGLPGDTHEKDIATAREIVGLGCRQVRIYPVIVIRGTVLHDMYMAGQYTPLTLDAAVFTCAQLYSYFINNGVRILKIGLHTDSDAAAGPFHPAFGELVRSKVFYNELTASINKHTRYLINVSPSFISTAYGNKKYNLNMLLNNGYEVEFSQDRTVKHGQFSITKL